MIEFGPSDILILYTDGITEAEDSSGEMLGQDRLMEFAHDAPVDTPDSAGLFLLNRLEGFRSEKPIDDETIIAIQRGNYS